MALYKALGGGWETAFPDKPVPPLDLAAVAVPQGDLALKPDAP